MKRLTLIWSCLRPHGSLVEQCGWLYCPVVETCIVFKNSQNNIWADWVKFIMNRMDITQRVNWEYFWRTFVDASPKRAKLSRTQIFFLLNAEQHQRWSCGPKRLQTYGSGFMVLLCNDMRTQHLQCNKGIKKCIEICCICNMRSQACFDKSVNRPTDQRHVQKTCLTSLSNVQKTSTHEPEWKYLRRIF